MSQTRALTVLVADDNRVIRELVRSVLERDGYTVCTAEDGSQAIELAKLFPPDVILLDRHMPGLGSLDVLRELKALTLGRWVPLIMVSADSAQESQIEALENGADDYIAKPINFKILGAKIRVFLHHVALQNELNEQRAELQRHRDRSERELDVTSYLMQRLMRADKLNDPNVSHWVLPAENFSGDLVAAARSQAGELYGLLADATGHGLSAAVNLIPLTQTFYAMVRKGFRLPSIATQMNQQLRQYTPPERFVALTLVLVNPGEGYVEVFNAGNPATLLIDAKGQVLHEFRSRSIPLGIVDEDQMVFESERANYVGRCQILVYSDGLTEACDSEGGAFGNARLRKAVSPACGAASLASLQQAVGAHVGAASPHDDISLLVLDCDVPGPPQVPLGVEAPADPDGVLWELALTVSQQQLREIELVPLLVDWARAMGLAPLQSGTFFTVVSELYANALDHGLLQLASDLKEQQGGYEYYMAERKRRLASLKAGWIGIELRQVRAGAGSRLHIAVSDSGSGFDATPWLRGFAADAAHLSGRGIALVHKLCDQLVYEGSGNRVVAQISY